ncbi:MAG: hypothetical protein AAF597_05670, partial [Bacteroidota bacterium]
GSYQDNLPHPDPWQGLVFRYRIGCTHANLYRKAALLEVGGWNEDLPDNEDPELHFRLLRAGLLYHIVPTVLCVYHHHDEGQLSGRDPIGGNRRRLELLEQITAYLKDRRPAYWATHQAFFIGALLRALRVYASHDLGAAAGAYARLFKQGFAERPALIAPLILKAYGLLGFRRTEQLRLALGRFVPRSWKDHLKNPRT